MQDFGEYINELGEEKFRAVIVHHKSTKDLSKFGHAVAEKYNGLYFDLLKHFQQNMDLSDHIDTFQLEKFIELLKEQAKDQSIVIVDNLNFLIDTWRKQEVDGFYRFIIRGWNSFIKSMNATLIICMYSSDIIKELTIIDTKGRSRVKDLSEFKAIELKGTL